MIFNYLVSVVCLLKIGGCLVANLLRGPYQDRWSWETVISYDPISISHYKIDPNPLGLH